MKKYVSKHKKKIIAMVIIILILLPILTFFSSGYAMVISPTKEKILENVDDPVDIYENKVLYKNDGLWLYNIDDKSKKRITSEKAVGEIYGDYVVYIQDEDINGIEKSIKSYKISTGEIKEIKEKHIAFTYSSPKIYENKVVWIDDRNYRGSETDEEPYRDIYLYDLTTNKEEQITYSKTVKTSIDFYENKIVWQDKRNTNDDLLLNYDIFMLDLSKEIEIPISTEIHYQGRPKIYKNTIIWLDERSGYSEIYYYKINIGKEKKVPQSTSANNIDIYGDYIVYDKTIGSGDVTNIYLYDLSTGKREIIENRGNAAIPLNHNNRIIWHENNNDIVLYTFPTNESYFYLIVLIISIITILILFIVLIRIRINERRRAKLETVESEESIEIKSLDSKQNHVLENKILCPNCDKPFRLSESKRHLKIKCPHCGIKGEID
jgi:beta propeller repeat protein